MSALNGELLIMGDEGVKRKDTQSKKDGRPHQSKLSKSYGKFEQTIKRSLNLIALQSAVEKILGAQAADQVDPGDLTRAGVVLSVAAMDAYFTDVFAERFIPFLKKRGPTKPVCKLLSDAGLTTKIALDLLAMERPYRRIRTLIEQYFERHTTQRVEAIDSLFIAYGLSQFSNKVAALKRRKRLLASVRKIVERRHRIAHDGDLNDHGRLIPIDQREMKKRIMDIVAYVAGSEEILQRNL